MTNKQDFPSSVKETSELSEQSQNKVRTKSEPNDKKSSSCDKTQILLNCLIHKVKQVDHELIKIAVV